MRLSDYVYCPCVVIKNKVKHDTIFTQLLKRVILVKSQNAIISCILEFHQKKSTWEKVCNLNGKKNVYVYDVNSMYPAQMLKNLPYGTPKYYQGQYKNDELYPL